LGLMWATKETFVFVVLSMALAAACTVWWTRWRGEPGLGDHARWSIKTAVAAIAIAMVIAMLFFSSFLANFAGIADAVKTYVPWLHRGEGSSPHVHPWYFYFARLLFYRVNGGPAWSEGLIAALAAVGFAAGLAGRCLGNNSAKLVRFIAFYTAWMTLIYSALPYKTPWCLLGFYHGMILLAGIGAMVLVRACQPQWLKFGVTALLAIGTAQLGWQAWRENFASDTGGVPYCDTVKNPYTYSPTAPDISRLMQMVDALAHVSPADYRTVVEVMSPDSYWPLPWYLRRFKQCGFWDKIPVQPPAPIMIVSTALHAEFDERPQRTHLMAGYFELRPNVFFELYVNVDLWAKYIKTLPPEKD
jgi:hypothetical protein